MADQPMDGNSHRGPHVSVPPIPYDYWSQQQQQQQQQQQLHQQQQLRVGIQNVMDYGHPPLPPPLHQPPPGLYQPPPPLASLGPLPMHLPPNQHHPMMTTLPPPPPFAPPNAQIQPTSVPNPQFFSSVPPPPRPPTTATAPIPQTPTATIPTLPKEPSRPDVPYYELPAGLMVPLVKLEDTDYRPLDPEQIRLPPPAPLSERLLQAVEAFYSPPSHERPRNEDGWEQLSLYDFFRVKSQEKKKKEIDRI